MTSAAAATMTVTIPASDRYCGANQAASPIRIMTAPMSTDGIPAMP